jgi:hypothetical protein
MRASPQAPNLDPIHSNHFSQCHYCHSIPSLIVDLDKIRAQAHRLGWRDAPYNPFGRVRSNDSQLHQPDPEQAKLATGLQASKDPNAPARQASNESQRSPTRIDTEEEEISSSTFVDGSANGDGLSRRHPTSVDAERVPTQPEPTDSDKEEEMKRMRKDEATILRHSSVVTGRSCNTLLQLNCYRTKLRNFAAAQWLQIAGRC